MIGSGPPAAAPGPPQEGQSAAMQSALLVMDMQQDVVTRFTQESDEVVGRTARAVAVARAAHVPVVFVRVAFRPGFPEVSADNRSFAALAARGGDAFAEDSPGTRVHPALAPLEGEPLVTKKRVSAFAGSDLELVLRALGARHLVLCGIATSGVVLSTLREAADRDYRLTVLSDACVDADPEVHRVLLEKVFPKQSEVVPVDTWAAALAG